MAELQAAVLGSIPAHAGEPETVDGRDGSIKVYPRACGGTAHMMPVGPFVQGLSPRMRGNHGQQAGGTIFRGSIPAHAGEPLPRRWSGLFCGVYPRACGGTSSSTRLSAPVSGLSPRMRGNRRGRPGRKPGAGSIPAHAGEPWWSAPGAWRSRVYPRACGGTSSWRLQSSPCGGLSPRMRGNPGRLGR